VITSDFDEDANYSTGSDGIYFTALQKTNAHLYRIDPHAGRASHQRSRFLPRYRASFTKDIAQWPPPAQRRTASPRSSPHPPAISRRIT